ncbi:transposase [Deferribacteraceae bacterium V6Fe1]|nr:transposase [Deferribacteraceae bacterium V6Fe1]UOD35840.1 transposase [Deferribacteraceae bacterium V6Fe1]UOD35866.1 transposase [Deferribacteraceae bacterium V6Fe1]UOD35910.1 transposase [Deferribacteraceae bacterium V6Fe1]UOD35912.1 transposase [Deferribacteraceae bacterium V6Fe1]
MIGEITKNVKGKMLNTTRNLHDYLTKPQQKYILEIISGCFATRSLNLTAISGYLNEKCGIKHTLKRLQRNTFNYSHLLAISNAYNIDYALKETESDSRLIISIDGGDLVHNYGRNFELIGKVHDGSSGRIANGFHLNHAVCYSPSSKRLFSLYLDAYSSKSQDFKSENTETLNMLDKLKDKFRNKGLFVFDRGYDRGVILRYLLREDLNFVIRSTGKRHLEYKGEKMSVYKICNGIINRRYKKGGISYGYAKCYYNNRAVTVISVSFHGNKNKLYFLCEGHISSSKEAYFRIKSYFKRWKIEESYRFMKQQFGLEKCLVRKFESLKTILSLVSFCWNVLSQIEKDTIVSKLLENMAKREKFNSKGKVVCKFIYYRISDGLMNLLLSSKERLFRFREKIYESDKVCYFKLDYYFKIKEKRHRINELGKMKRKKSLLVA